MSLYVQTFKLLKPGTLCRLNRPGNKHHNKIITYIDFSQFDHYLFQLKGDPTKLISCDEDTEFIILPNEQELKKAIDLSLDIKNEELFLAFTSQLHKEEYNDGGY